MTNLGNGGSAYNAQLKNSASISSSSGAYVVGTAAATFSASTSDYIQINSPSLTFATTGVSFAFWFRANADPQWARIFDFGNDPPGGNTGIDNVLVTIDNNYLTANVYVTTTTDLHKSNAWGVYVNDNTWRHAAWTIDASGTWLIYLNGALVSTYTRNGYPNKVARQYNYLGRSGWAGDPYFTGGIDEFYLFNYVLTAAQVLSLYNHKSI